MGVSWARATSAYAAHAAQPGEQHRARAGAAAPLDFPPRASSAFRPSWMSQGVALLAALVGSAHRLGWLCCPTRLEDALPPALEPELNSIYFA
jgi:hypothetical protein